jgi:hypothetical protein
VLTDPDLIEYSKEHVRYEISMLVSCGQLLNQRFQSPSAAFATVLRSAVIESFANHVRNIADFLYPGTNVKSTDVLADDFSPHGKRPAVFPSLPDKLEAARQRAHKQVSHLTTGRLSRANPSKQWPAPDLVDETLQVLREVCKASFNEQAGPFGA